MTVAHYVLLGRTAHLGPLGRETAARPRPGRRGPHPPRPRRPRRPPARHAVGRRAPAGRARPRAWRRRRRCCSSTSPPPRSTSATSRTSSSWSTTCAAGSASPSCRRCTTSRSPPSTPTTWSCWPTGRVALSGPAGAGAHRPAAAHHYGARVDVIRHRGNLVVVPWRDDHPTGDRPMTAPRTRGHPHRRSPSRRPAPGAVARARQHRQRQGQDLGRHRRGRARRRPGLARRRRAVPQVGHLEDRRGEGLPPARRRLVGDGRGLHLGLRRPHPGPGRRRAARGRTPRR